MGLQQNSLKKMNAEGCKSSILGDILKNGWLDNFCRITQIKNLPGADETPELPTVGLVFDEVGEDRCPDLDGARVLKNGVPVTAWEWLGMQRLAD